MSKILYRNKGNLVNRILIIGVLYGERLVSDNGSIFLSLSQLKIRDLRLTA